MSYEYTDEKRASEPHALPDVQVWETVTDEIECERGCGVFTIPWEMELRCPSCETLRVEVMPRPTPYSNEGFFYAYGFPGCLWDSDPVGPFETYSQALEQAREDAGVYDQEGEI